MKEVTAAIIIKGNKVLIAQRAPGGNLADKWEFPGGKIEHGETLQECLKREIREELDVDIEVSDFFGESIYTYNSGTIKLMAFWCKWISGEFTLWEAIERKLLSPFHYFGVTDNVDLSFCNSWDGV